jgi:hypothetical protein
MAVMDVIRLMTTCAYDYPSIPSVATSVPHKHTRATTTFKHFKPHKLPSAPKVSVGLPVAPPVQAIIVDSITPVDPQFATIIRNETESIVGASENSQTACPTCGEVIVSGKAGPFASCIPVVHDLSPTTHVGSATIQVGASTTLVKVVYILPKEAMTINGVIA